MKNFCILLLAACKSAITYYVVIVLVLGERHSLLAVPVHTPFTPMKVFIGNKNLETSDIIVQMFTVCFYVYGCFRVSQLYSRTVQPRKITEVTAVKVVRLVRKIELACNTRYDDNQSARFAQKSETRLIKCLSRYYGGSAMLEL